MSKWNEISIHDPLSGDQEKFLSIQEAKRAARKKNYTPVFIDLFDENGIEESVKVENKVSTKVKYLP